MLKRKVGICPECPPGTPATYLTAGKCQIHYWAGRQKVAQQRSSGREVGQPNKNSALGVWFDFHNANCNWICDNCSKPLNPINAKVRSSCQAHILPKSLFKSVQANLDNHLVLGDLMQECFCHDDYDQSWQKAQTMPVFALATERFLKFKHLILPAEYKHLPDVFHSLI